MVGIFNPQLFPWGRWGPGGQIVQPGGGAGATKRKRRQRRQIRRQVQAQLANQQPTPTPPPPAFQRSAGKLGMSIGQQPNRRRRKKQQTPAFGLVLGPMAIGFVSVWFLMRRKKRKK